MPSSLGFPSSPTTSQQYTVGSRVFVWDGSVWNLVSSAGSTLTQAQVQDFAAPILTHSGHTNITASYNDVTNRVNLVASGGSGGGTDIGLLIALS